MYEEPNIEWVEAVAIMVSWVIVVLVTAGNDWAKERQFRGLQNKIDSDHRITTIRCGEPMELPVDNLLVGDIVMVKYGGFI